MRIAFISDIHGNLHALELVLADIKNIGVDQIICLGDIASLGPQPREVIARLAELQIPILMGNHETYLLNLQMTENHHPWLRAAELWCAAELTQSELNFLRSFPPQLNLTLGQDTRVLCYHASPRSNEEWIFPNISTESLEEIITGETAQLMIGGHTHVQMLRQHKGLLIVNPGSVGMPFEYPMRGQNQHALRWAEYAILDLTKDKFTTHLQRLPVDFDELSKIARASTLPDIDFWLSQWWV